MKFLKVFVVVVVTSSFLFLQGCEDFWGGGWLWSEIDPEKRVTLGFEGICDDSSGDAVLTLNLTFHDRGFTGDDVYNQNRNGKKHMAIYSSDQWSVTVIGFDCGEADEEFNIGDGEGIVVSYCPQGLSSFNIDDCGIMGLYVTDTGDGGPSKGDTISVGLEGGHYDGYDLEGPLQGGNVTIAF